MSDYRNSGILFREKDVQPNDKRPLYTGKLDVEGREWRLAAWVRQGKNGPFMSLKLSEPRQGGGGPTEGGEESIPFVSLADVRRRRADL